MTCLTAKRLSLVAVASLALGGIAVPAPADAQVRAMLTTIDQMEPLQALPIDGMWEVREIGKRIVIENGHAYAEDSWVHMMLFRIEPDQVVIKNIRELAGGGFVGQDLPLMAGVTFEWIDEETLQGRTDGSIPVVYHLDRVDGFDAEYSDNPWDTDTSEEDDVPLIELPENDNDKEYVEPW